MPRLITILGCLLIAGCCVAFTSSDAHAPNYECHSDTPVIDTIKNKTGLLFFDDSLRAYAVRTVPKGTIDETDIYLLCPLPARLPALNSNVIVSGYVRRSPLKADLASVTFFELTATAIK